MLPFIQSILEIWLITLNAIFGDNDAKIRIKLYTLTEKIIAFLALIVVVLLFIVILNIFLNVIFAFSNI